MAEYQRKMRELRSDFIANQVLNKPDARAIFPFDDQNKQIKARKLAMELEAERQKKADQQPKQKFLPTNPFVFHQPVPAQPQMVSDYAKAYNMCRNINKAPIFNEPNQLNLGDEIANSDYNDLITSQDEEFSKKNSTKLLMIGMEIPYLNQKLMKRELNHASV